MPGSIMNGGAWRSLKGVSAFNGGAWKKAKAAWVMSGGVWRKFFTSGFSIARGADCSLLVHADGSLIDESVTAKAPLSIVGGVTLDASQGIFNSPSIRVPGGADSYVTVPASSDFDFGTGNFTIDLWARRNGTPAQYTGLITGGALANWKLLYSTSGRLTLEAANRTATETTAAADLTWTHYALVRNGTILSLYRNGTLTAQVAISAGAAVNSAGLGLRIGCANLDSSGLCFNGWIDEVHIQKGTARWTTNFTPPAYPYGDEEVLPELRYRWVRWLITETRTVTSPAAQASEFRLLLGGSPVGSATATQAGFTSSATEAPDKLVDGSLSGKWCDTNFNARGSADIVFDYGTPVKFDGYQYATANDETMRDPRDWTLQGSNDGFTWDVLHTVSGFTATASRGAWQAAQSPPPPTE